MGGCRCFFRNCTVRSLQLPDMHFFHFPLKNEELMAKWIFYTGYTEISNLTLKQQKNRSICARHFRDECFMNYKKNRLVPNAIPTLHRLSETEALDYEPNPDHPVSISIKKPLQEHLIAPQSFQCPLGFSAEEVKLHESILNRYRNSRKSSRATDVKSESLMELNLDDMLIPKKKMKIINMGINNKQASDSSNSEMTQVSTDIIPTKVKKKIDSIQLRETPQTGSMVYTIDFQKTNNQGVETIESIACKPCLANDSRLEKLVETVEVLELKLEAKTAFAEELQQKNCKLANLGSKIITEMEELRTKSLNRKRTSKALYINYQLLQGKYNQLRDDHLNLQTEYRNLQGRQTILPPANIVSKSREDPTSEPTSQSFLTIGSLTKEPSFLQEQHTVSTSNTMSVSVNETNKMSPSNYGNLTKLQIFNGAKKYICQSMQALLRMEMFGSTEREWKVDERRVSLDLLRLGQHVYQYFADEWRVRLPSMQDSMSWLAESNETDDEDDL